MKRIIIVENDNFLLELLCDHFNFSGRFTVVATTTRANESLVLCRKTMPDAVLMDICTDDGNYGGIRAGSLIKKEFPQIKVILITGLPEFDFIRLARKGNIDSFLYKTDTIQNLYQAVEQTLQGASIWPDMTPSHQVLVSLSDRELEVARLICCACLNRREIAEKLGLSQNSIKTYTERIYEKINVKNSRELMKYMLANGLLLPED